MQEYLNSPTRQAQPLRIPFKASSSSAASFFPVLFMTDTLAHLYELLGDAVLLPIPKGKKKPVLKEWQKITFADTQESGYQKQLAECVRRGGNIGVLLGPASNDLHA